MSIGEILLKLDDANSGFEVTKRNGILTSTWAIYKRNDYYYYFDINEKFDFDENHKYSRQELEEEYKNSYFNIDCEI